MLFDRVVKSSREEITDKDILDLDHEEISHNSEKDISNPSPVKAEMENR